MNSELLLSHYIRRLIHHDTITSYEKNPDNSWVANAFENGVLQHNYNLDCSPIHSDGQEHELWWNITCELDWYLHTFIELRIMEVH